MCCTRICHVDTLGTLVVGPMSYGTAYVRSGATFDGQNTAQNWFVYTESGATVLNYSGNVVQCTNVTFPAAMCFMSVPEQYQSTVSAVQNANLLSFSFSSVLTKARVELYDPTGKIVMTSTQAQCNRQDLDVSTLPSGVHM